MSQIAFVPETAGWVRVEPVEGSILAGDQYLVVWPDGLHFSTEAASSFTQRNFDKLSAYYVKPRS